MYCDTNQLVQRKDIFLCSCFAGPRLSNNVLKHSQHISAITSTRFLKKEMSIPKKKMTKEIPYNVSSTDLFGQVFGFSLGNLSLTLQICFITDENERDLTCLVNFVLVSLNSLGNSLLEVPDNMK